jgi:hypothetical protein
MFQPIMVQPKTATPAPKIGSPVIGSPVKAGVANRSEDVQAVGTGSELLKGVRGANQQ